MKVLFTGLFPIWQCHIVGECNFIEEHFREGDIIDVLTCDADLQSCNANPGRDLMHCLACMEIRENALSMLDKAVGKKPLLRRSAIERAKHINPPLFKNLDELKKFYFLGMPVGLDIVSSVMTAVGDAEFDTVIHADRIKKTINDYLGTYFTAVEYLGSNEYSLVYIFNGRFAPAKAWIRACEITGIDYFTMERLGMPDRVMKIKNGTVHGLSSYSRWIQEFWEKNQNDPEVRKEAVDFFEERPKGLMTGWFSFVAGQEKKRLPPKWDPLKRNIAIFSSTETEFSGISEVFSGALYSDQKTPYLKFAQIAKERNPDVRFHLRIHPNSKSEKRRWWEDDDFQNLSNLTVIPPESSVSSYELMQSCEKTVVFMTTMGIEASYWGKPSILLSNSMYKGIGAVYEPSTEEEAIGLILERDLAPKPREATLSYGGFIRMGYPKLPYSEALDHCTLTFKGERPNASPRAIHALWKWEKYINKPWIPKWIKNIWERNEFSKLSLSITQ